jgi:AcrR family transcriptional regulator
VTVTAEDSRRRLTAKQVAVVDRLVDAAAGEARELGYEATTVRGAAKRAGVAPATAYTYFASKDHLLAEVLWRRMDGLPQSRSKGKRALDRVRAELELLGLFMADDPVLATACTTALLGAGPEVRAVRVRFGTVVHRRLESALGAEAEPEVLEALDLAYSGAMLWAGMGHLEFEEVPPALSRLAAQLLAERP